MHEEAGAVVVFCAAYWWVIAGPGSPSWRAGFGLAVTEYPRRYQLVPRPRPVRA